MGKTELHRVLRRPISSIAMIVSDPLETWTALQDRIAARKEAPVPPGLYQADEEWEPRLSRLIGLTAPSDLTAEFWPLWRDVIRGLESKGVKVGPESFKSWNDGDAALVRAIWFLTRQMRPRNVVETGVAHGVTSRVILEALAKNGSGHLFSIDHPPMEPEWRRQIGLAVDGRHIDRWTYISGSSKRKLPQLASQLGQIDLFVHDSLHSEHNVLFELDVAWRALRPGGAIVVDDIDTNRGFQSFTAAVSPHPFLICEADPLRPDPRRSNKKGMFGIILKQNPASHPVHNSRV